MLDKATIKKISDFVYAKPRTIQEIAFLIRKNWRTADSYVDKIANEFGTLSVRTFREGTRGALKVVYWNNIEKISSSEFQERLFKQIEAGRKKEDFSPFDIYQYVDEKKRNAFIEAVDHNKTENQQIINMLRSAKKQILCFSGNLSWINLVENNKPVLKAIEELADKNISIKILSRVDIATLSNLKKALEINNKLGKEAIEIRHCMQPLRGFIIDNKIARFKEEKTPETYKKGELEKKTLIFYEIFDEEYIDWLQKAFWNLFRVSIDANKRLKDLELIAK